MSVRSPPIIVEMIGGLGNQMFQYAFGRAVAESLDRPLWLDTSGFAEYPLRRFNLPEFVAPHELAPPSMARRLRLQRSRLGRLLPQALRIQEVRERTHAYHQLESLLPSRVVHLSGYWQTERYFVHRRSQLLAEFTPKLAPTGLNAELMSQIRGSEAISLHVRRGDYVSNPATAAYHGVCGTDYYEAASREIMKGMASPQFFIFSDDIEWVRSNLKIDAPCVYIGHNGDRPWEDLRLMSVCRRFVIANSSFSWWGAWLSDSPAKRVIAPKRWFVTDEKDARDQIPESWERF